MLSHRRTGLWLLLLITLSACVPKAESEGQVDPPLDPQTQAQIDMEGEDLMGRDGPLVKVGFDLALLYREFEAYSLADGAEAGGFVPSDARLRVADGLVAIDFVASGETEVLMDALIDLGLVDEAAFGRNVSGRLPIAAIAEMAALDSLQSARPVLAATR